MKHLRHILSLGILIALVSSASAQSGSSTVFAWGWNPYGQTTLPAGLSNVVALAGGRDHSLALRSDGTVAAWGLNNYGQTTLPAGLSNVVALAAGSDYSLALRRDGTVTAWGRNDVGQTDIPAGLSNVVAIAGGGEHILALRSDGTVVAWGQYWNGSAYLPMYVPAGLSNVVAIARGSEHSLALRSDGTVAAWGINNQGQTTLPAGLSNVVAIAGGFYYSLALRSNGTVAAWGQYYNGSAYVPMYVPAGLSNVVAIAGGGEHSLALRSDGTVVAWGQYYNGSAYVPMYVPAGLSNVVAIAGGGYHSLALISPLQLSSDLTNVTAVVGGDATFAVGASGAEPFTYQWFYTNSYPPATAGAYAQTIAGFVYGAVVTNGGFGYGAAPNVQFIGGGGAGALGYSSVSNGSVISVTITNAGFGYFSPPAVVFDPPSGLLVDQTNSTLTISNVGPSNLGSYWVVVSNGSGSVTSSVANITLLYPPSIAVPPVSQNLALRGATTLSVTAAGTPPFSYQWTLAGTNLPSATNSTLALTNFSLAQAGSYAVRVSSPYGTATSSSAQVSMLPSLNVPFAGGVNLWGQPATLTVGAVGTGPLVYQWYFNGQTIAGATSNSYTIPTIQFTNAGFYSVVVSSSLGSVTNTPYQVVVNPANVSLGLYPGITVSGTVGYTYTIQGTTDLSDTNAWVTLANLTLTQPVQIWSDYTADTTQPQNPRKFYRVVAGNVPAGMALIPAGPFTMGDTLDGDANALPVTVTVSAFYMDTNLVSKAVWDDVYSWAIGHGYTFDNVGSGKASTHPVQTINWYDSVKWCNARSEKEGRAPAYYTDAGLTTVYRSGQLSPSVNWAAGYRLPTEAEWEKAARGGMSGQRFPWGNTISQSLANFQNIGGESYQTGPTGFHATYATGAQPYTSPVGSFAPNGYGLFDMAGNVWQWCWDWYGTPYAGGTDPRGAASGSSRVDRGGSWGDNAFYCRAAYRDDIGSPTYSGNNIGFRSVLPPGQ